MNRIICRSRRFPDCYHGREAAEIYEDGDIADDATYDGRSVVCDCCYIAIGAPGVDVRSADAATFPRRLEGGRP